MIMSYNNWMISLEILILKYFCTFSCSQVLSSSWVLTTCYSSLREGKLVQFVAMLYILSPRARLSQFQVLPSGPIWHILRMRTGLLSILHVKIV